MIMLEPVADGIVIPVRASPGARRNEVRGEQAGALKVCVTQVAEKGKANMALRALLAKALRLRKSQIELVAGETTLRKRFLVRNISCGELQQRVTTLLGQVE